MAKGNHQFMYKGKLVYLQIVRFTRAIISLILDQKTPTLRVGSLYLSAKIIRSVRFFIELRTFCMGGPDGPRTQNRAHAQKFNFYLIDEDMAFRGGEIGSIRKREKVRN